MIVGLSDKVKEALHNEEYIVSGHYLQMINERNLNDFDIIEALINGQIIEQRWFYPDEEHYLVYCEQGKKKFHVVLGYNHGTLTLITIYVPDKNHFENDRKTRKKKI